MYYKKRKRIQRGWIRVGVFKILWSGKTQRRWQLNKIMKQVMDSRYLDVFLYLESIPGRRNRKGKGAEVEICLFFGRNSRRSQYEWNRISERKRNR